MRYVVSISMQLRGEDSQHGLLKQFAEHMRQHLEAEASHWAAHLHEVELEDIINLEVWSQLEEFDYKQISSAGD